ncbi:hypothetical protein K8089_02855 [Aequorivita sp. F47161]|jgi:hypothetical protein|uniref:Uncharacterized protein n=1 Tax=Aequorivita vitellina TaxID=2874475 RepID=A0A9X1U269_9FLAO|nr:hypothetical protein [Aequorivita vitellina]MCG2417947.1 hypothetical protein [Aequorivita vitellina]
MIEFIKNNLEYIVPIVLALIGGSWLVYKKVVSKTNSNDVKQKNIRTKSGDVVGRDKIQKK